MSIANENMLVKNENLTGASFFFPQMATIIFFNFSHDRYKQLSIIGSICLFIFKKKVVSFLMLGNTLRVAGVPKVSIPWLQLGWVLACLLPEHPAPRVLPYT